jgi:hypothetical protein
MRRNTADLNDEWLDEALQAFATCQQAREIIAAFDSVNMEWAIRPMAPIHPGQPHRLLAYGVNDGGHAASVAPAAIWSALLILSDWRSCAKVR